MDLFQSDPAVNQARGAVISPCGRYRFKLWRIWDEKKPKVLFMMHNPSTADSYIDDPTVRRCIGFATSWGYGGIYIGNLFPYRATDPKDLLKIPFDELAPGENLIHQKEMEKLCQLHVLAFGNPVVKDCTPKIFDKHWHYLKLTKTGNPCHPLYLKSNLRPIPMPQDEKVNAYINNIKLKLIVAGMPMLLLNSSNSKNEQ